MSLAPRMGECGVAGRVAAHLLHGLDSVVGNGYSLIVSLPNLVRSVVVAGVIVAYVAPTVNLVVEHSVGIMLVGIRQNHVVVDKVVAAQLADYGWHGSGVARCEQQGNLLLGVNLCTVVGYFVQFVATRNHHSGSHSNHSRCAQAAKQVSHLIIYIAHNCIFALLLFRFVISTNTSSPPFRSSGAAWL